MHAPKVIALLEGSGGVTGGFRTRIQPYVGKGAAVVVSDADPIRLLAKAEVALQRLERATARSLVAPSAPVAGPTTAGRPVMVQGATLDAAALKGREVFAFLGHERGMSLADRASAELLIAQIHAREGAPGVPLLVVPARTGLTEDVAAHAQARGLQTLGISAAATEAQHLQLGYATRGLDRVQLTGKGAGVGEFAALRPVVEHASVVFVAGGDHQTLGGTVFAAYRSTVVAVLTTGGRTMSGHLEQEIWKTFEKPTVATMIYDSDPVRLYQRAIAAADALRGRARGEYINAE